MAVGRDSRAAAKPAQNVHSRQAASAVAQCLRWVLLLAVLLLPIAACSQQAEAPVAVAPPKLGAHPRLLLDAATLTALRQRAAAATPEWQRLKTQCDTYLGGTINAPRQEAYPNRPNLGAGYQGDVYFAELMNQAMCYQALKVAQPKAASRYGAKAVKLLMSMSTPYADATGNQGWNPCNDDGYGIRFYGVGFGLGYDWLYELLTPDQRKQVYATANAWISAWENPSTSGCAHFEYEHPQSNYFAGYFHAKVAVALATYGDNPEAPAQWSDWLGKQFARRVQPYYAGYLNGGGWPEGYGNYAPLGVLNMSLPAREVLTATGIDLVHAKAAYRFAPESGDYLMHFTWPSRGYFDDRDTNHATGTGVPPGTTQTGLFEQVLGEMRYWRAPHTHVMQSYVQQVRKITDDFAANSPWLSFLEVDPHAASAPLDNLPRSYLAPGMGMVAARSDWGTSAVWMSFRAGPYVNNPGQGEQGFDQGSVALVRGGVPLLVNATGWMVHEPKGSASEDQTYADLFGDFDHSQYKGNRQLYNVFYVRDMDGQTLRQRFGQIARTGDKRRKDDDAKTGIDLFEDGASYVVTRGTHLEDMYRQFSSGPAVQAWSRLIVYLRPGRFVVIDSTRAGSAAYDQYLAFHFPAKPVAVVSAGTHRYEVTYDGHFAGAMTPVLPALTDVRVVPLYPDSPTAKVWQLQLRPGEKAISHHWLTVFDLATSPEDVALAAPLADLQGAAAGVSLNDAQGCSVVVAGAMADGRIKNTTISYRLPKTPAAHWVVQLEPESGYAVTVLAQGDDQRVTIKRGGPLHTSKAGVLVFRISTAGQVIAGAAKSVGTNGH